MHMNPWVPDHSSVSPDVTKYRIYGHQGDRLEVVTQPEQEIAGIGYVAQKELDAAASLLQDGLKNAWTVATWQPFLIEYDSL